MEKILLNILFFFVLAVFVFLVDYFIVLKRKLKSKKFKNTNIMEINYLMGKFKLDEKKILFKPVCLYCALINGFIISFTVTVISNIDINMTLQLLIGFVILFALIYSVYEIYGRILVKKGWQRKDV